VQVGQAVTASGGLQGGGGFGAPLHIQEGLGQTVLEPATACGGRCCLLEVVMPHLRLFSACHGHVSTGCHPLPACAVGAPDT